jgi:hypothetical protein
MNMEINVGRYNHVITFVGLVDIYQRLLERNSTVGEMGSFPAWLFL